jgi:DNA-directed RNA polymerase specialized sigma24 family protein
MDDEFDSPYYIKNDLDCVRYALEQLHWYDKILIEQYYIKGMTFRDLHVKYNISLNSLKKDINSALNKIRKICSQI